MGTFQDQLYSGEDYINFNQHTIYMTPEMVYDFFSGITPEQETLEDCNIKLTDDFGNLVPYTDLVNYSVTRLFSDTPDALAPVTTADEAAQHQAGEAVQYQTGEAAQCQTGGAVQYGSVYYTPANIGQGNAASGFAYPDPETSLVSSPYYVQSSNPRPQTSGSQPPVRGTRKRALEPIETSRADGGDESVVSVSPPPRPTKKRRSERFTPTTKTRKATPSHLDITQQRIISRQRNKNFDGSKVYEPLPSTPKPWSWFSYDRTGVLRNGAYSADSILDFLYDHPLHARNQQGEIIDRQRRTGLELFIQKVPADSNNRYPTIESKDCRFEECPMDRNNIDVGHFRVCLFERRSTVPQDPYHNAGYVHLYCIEHFMDFPQIIRDLCVKPETRKFNKEPQTKTRVSKMELDRGLKSTAMEFIRNCKDNTLVGYPTPEELREHAHIGTLTYRLHEAKLADENPVRGKVRAERQGKLTLDKHMGDLRFIMVNRGVKRKNGKKTIRVNQADSRGPPLKRRRVDDSPSRGRTTMAKPPDKIRRSSRGKQPLVQSNEGLAETFVNDTIRTPAPEWLQKHKKGDISARWVAQAAADQQSAASQSAQSPKRERKPVVKIEDDPPEYIDPAALLQDKYDFRTLFPTED